MNVITYVMGKLKVHLQKKKDWFYKDWSKSLLHNVLHMFYFLDHLGIYHKQ